MKILTKFLVIGLSSLIFQSCSENKCDCSLIYKDKDSQLYFFRETNKIYTGKCEEIYGDGKTKFTKEYFEGKKVSTINFYETGEKNYDENYDKAGMFTSSKTYYKNGKTKTEETFNSSNKNTCRIGYYTNGQISYQETISYDTLTYKTFQENGKPIVDKQAVINMNWTNYLKAGQSLSNSDTCITDYKEPYFKGYLTYFREYYQNGNPKYLLEFKENSVSKLNYKFDFSDRADYIKYRGNVPLLNILTSFGANALKPGSKVFFENGKTCYESIQAVKCALFIMNVEVIGIHFNENGNIFALQTHFTGSDSTSDIDYLYYFKNGAWVPLDFLPFGMAKILDVPISVITNINQICGE